MEATFLLRPALNGAPQQYSLEVAAAPGSYITTFNQTDIGKPGFCHYDVCVPVVVIPDPAAAASSSLFTAAAYANQSTFALPTAAAGFETYASAGGGSTPVLALPVPSTYYGGADLAPVLSGCPLNVQRFMYPDGDDLLLRFTVSSPQNASGTLELGAFGLSLPIDQFFTGRSLAQIGTECSFADPYIGGETEVLQTNVMESELRVSVASKRGGEQTSHVFCHASYAVPILFWSCLRPCFVCWPCMWMGMTACEERC